MRFWLTMSVCYAVLAAAGCSGFTRPDGVPDRHPPDRPPVVEHVAEPSTEVGATRFHRPPRADDDGADAEEDDPLAGLKEVCLELPGAPDGTHTTAWTSCRCAMLLIDQPRWNNWSCSDEFSQPENVEDARFQWLGD